MRGRGQQRPDAPTTPLPPLPSQGYLGLGSILYLNYMRYMAFLFILIGIFSIPNAYVNSRGDRCVLNPRAPRPFAVAEGRASPHCRGTEFCRGAPRPSRRVA